MIETTTWLPDLFYSEMSTLGPSSLAEVIQQNAIKVAIIPLTWPIATPR